MRFPTLLGWLALAFVAHASPSAAENWVVWTTPGTGAEVWLFDAAPHDEPAPVVVFLHGSGARAADWRSWVQPAAEALGAVVLLPQALSDIGFGVGADDATIAEALDLLRAFRPIEEEQIALAGHSAGGAFALSLTFGSVSRFSAVFVLSSPYRQLLEVADPDYAAPVRLYYGTEDPNYASSYPAWRAVLDRLGITWEEEIRFGYGHSSWPDTTLEDGFRFLLTRRYGDPGPCRPNEETLCLHEGRFRVRASWSDFDARAGTAKVVPRHRSDSGMLWFFRPENWELLVKVLDGCAVNGSYWVLSSATTNVAYVLEIEDLVSGESWLYENPLGQLSPAHADIEAFAACPEGPSEPPD